MFLLLWVFIQIIAESLPISSSGHVALLHEWFGVDMNTLEHQAIQCLLHIPTLIILCTFFKDSWRALVVTEKKSNINFLKIVYWVIFVCIVDLITGLVWLSKISQQIPDCFLPVGFGITALLLCITRFFKSDVAALQFSMLWHAVVFGIAQSIGLCPGISRFAITYVVGLCLGYGYSGAFSLSFLIQVPLIVLAIIKSLFVFNFVALLSWLSFKFFIFILFVSWLSYKLFYLVAILIKENQLWYFALYMIIPISISLWLCKGLMV